MAHLHITSWVLALILFALALMFYKQGKKPSKILHMILRLDYLLILYSGGTLLSNYFNGSMLPEAIIKALAGIWVIAALELLLVRVNKGKPVLGMWVQLGVALIIVLALGFGRLPLGILP
ncbi:YisL family protein [Sediminibacillus massiliensis]|uniref:YisL family protein n=1 Tax=Sediminibacillus massiliensis TaxID=1926277 RepID=UPI00098837EC|nr:YisL family protein [Sediminibacillus massiliensis]